ncbi:MAG: hypothetical protein IKW96_07670 [Ruminococcus sp.]|uniref:hypothetical protein n=1 Tax=Ruminococcus sp. TaxID=41978 RepID=UPI0025EBDE68|nr:hypothetical protein [Ruminococcus sp.]MBR5683143.1 hypothetical protein [Ruminococcus sp.]
MAYCKYCGKLIPEGGSCDCPAAKGESEIKETAVNIGNAAESVKSEAAEAAREVKEAASDTINEIKSEAAGAAQKVDAVAGEAAEKLPGKAKNNKGLVYIVAGIIAALLLFLIIALCSSGGSTSAVKKYIKSSYEKRGAKTMYSLTLPKRVIRELKEDDDYDEMVDSYNDMIEDMIDDLDGKETLPKFDKITRKNPLKKSELKMAEQYFNRICDKYDAEEGGMRVTKGYEVKVKSRYKSKSGEMEHRTDIVCVVKLRGDGWKIITHPLSELSYYN